MYEFIATLPLGRVFIGFEFCSALIKIFKSFNNFLRNLAKVSREICADLSSSLAFNYGKRKEYFSLTEKNWGKS